MAKTVAQELIRSSDVLGLGSGSAVARFAKALGERVKKESLKVTIVPSSMQSWLLATENGLALASDSTHCPPIVDVVVDGADQISLPTRSMIKGGGGALLKEKIIISSAKKCYILADESKYVQKLNRSVPVEVTQFSVLSVEHKVKKQTASRAGLEEVGQGVSLFHRIGKRHTRLSIQGKHLRPRRSSKRKSRQFLASWKLGFSTTVWTNSTGLIIKEHSKLSERNSACALRCRSA